MLTVVDDCTRECLALVADTSLSGLRVARELETLIATRGRPRMIVSDNGTEFTSNAILGFADRRRIDWHYIARRRPGRCRRPDRPREYVRHRQGRAAHYREAVKW